MEIFELEAVAPMCLLINLLSRNFKTSIAKKYSCLFVIYTYLPEQNILPCVSLYNIYLFYYPSNHCRNIPKNLYEVVYLLRTRILTISIVLHRSERDQNDLYNPEFITLIFSVMNSGL